MPSALQIVSIAPFDDLCLGLQPAGSCYSLAGSAMRDLQVPVLTSGDMVHTMQTASTY